MTKINIQFSLFSAFYSPLISMMSGGFLKEEGLKQIGLFRLREYQRLLHLKMALPMWCNQR